MKKTNATKKRKIYAIFQFMSFAGTTLFLLGLIFISASVKTSGGLPTIQAWTDKLSNSLSFSNIDQTSIVAGILIYIAILLWVISWIVGLGVLSCSDRTLFDSLFLVFIVIPIFANFIGIIAQIVETKIFLTDATIDKESIIQEQTTVMELKIKKENTKTIQRDKKTKKTIK